VNILLDTQALIWTLEDNPKLSAAAREKIIDAGNLVFVSTVSVWEISIKKALGKLKAPDTLIEEVISHRFAFLEISAQHADLAGRLPAIHQDPFDRMLIAQAKIESLALMSKDSFMQRYDVKLIST